MKSRDCHVYFYLNELQLLAKPPSQSASNPDRLMATTLCYALLILQETCLLFIASFLKKINFARQRF
jgi:hypothetical protein